MRWSRLYRRAAPRATCVDRQSGDRDDRGRISLVALAALPAGKAHIIASELRYRRLRDVRRQPLVDPRSLLLWAEAVGLGYKQQRAPTLSTSTRLPQSDKRSHRPAAPVPALARMRFSARPTALTHSFLATARRRSAEVLLVASCASFAQPQDVVS